MLIEEEIGLLLSGDQTTEEQNYLRFLGMLITLVLWRKK